MRHIELAHHFLKEKTTDGTCIVTKVRTEDNNSDIGTKRVPLPLFISLTSRLVNRDLRNNKLNKPPNLRTIRLIAIHKCTYRYVFHHTHVF
jgi:hypothetical protein